MLRSLDDRLVPPAARAAQDLARRSGRAWGAVVAWGRRQVARLLALPARLHRSTVVLIAAAGAVLLSGVGALLAYPGPGPAYPIDPTATASLGPAAGEPVATYAARAAGRLSRLTESAPDAPAYALVDLTGYWTPQQVAGLVGSLTLRLVYVHVPVAGLPTEVYPIAVTGPGSLGSGLTELSRRSRLAATEEMQVLGLPGSKLPAVLVKAIRLRATALAREAVGFGPDCRCVFALVVRGTVRSLARLARRPVARVVDPAPPDVGFAGLAFQWVLPETSGRFPPGGLPAAPA